MKIALAILCGFIAISINNVLYKFYARKEARQNGIPIPKLKWYEWIK